MSTNLERRFSYATTLLASAARVASGDSSATPVTIMDAPNALQLVLDVSAGATDNTDTLVVTVRTMIDGVNWEDIAAFTTVGGGSPIKRIVAKIVPRLGPGVTADAALTAGQIRHLVGDRYMIAWTIVSGNAASFTFSVLALPC